MSDQTPETLPARGEFKWRGDPVDRRAQELAGAEFAAAYGLHREAFALEGQLKKIDELRRQRDAHLGVVQELRFSAGEAAMAGSELRRDTTKPLSLIPAYQEFVAFAKRSEARRCSDCQIERKHGSASCAKHTEANLRPPGMTVVANQLDLLKEGARILTQAHNESTSVGPEWRPAVIALIESAIEAIEGAGQ